MTRLLITAMVLLAGLVAGSGLGGSAATPHALTAAERGAEKPAVGVLVEQTTGASPAAVRAATAEVERLRASGARAELRVTPSPSQALGAAASLAAGGAERLVTYGADPAVVAALRSRGLDVVERR
jgi:hypothetical protein